LTCRAAATPATLRDEDPMSDDRPFGSSNWTLVVAAMLLVPFLLWVTGVIDFDDSRDAAPAGPTLQPGPTASPTTPPAEATAPAPAVTRSDPDAVIDDDAPTEVAASLARAEAGDLPSLGAIWSDGRVHLVGAVPGRDEAATVIAVAERLVGPVGVVDALVLDERADAPALLEVRVDEASAWAPDSATLDPALVPVAEAVASVLAEGAARQVTVVAHLDDTGDPIAALDATRRRAQAFAEAVVDAGASRSQVTAIGRGSSRPLTHGDDNDAERNRRIDLVFDL
jgi:outer membrane protein OmpA-like peptidoglycan-associated protein